MQILVLFDGSENAMRAVNFTGQMVEKAATEVKVTLLQVVGFWESAAWGFLTLPEEKQKEMIDRARQQAGRGMEKAEKLLAESGAAVEPIILVGEPVATIIEYTEQAQPDLIVMGSRGMGPVRELVLGGICHKVLQLAKQPVVVVK